MIFHFCLEKTDNEIHSILKNEFEKVELTLKENQQELLMKRSSRSVLNGEVNHLICFNFLKKYLQN